MSIICFILFSSFNMALVIARCFTIEASFLRYFMQLILNEFGSTRKQELKDVHSLFLRVIARLEDIYQVHPFNQQTAQSLTELFALVQATQPRTIFELGAGSRSSTLALSLAVARM